MLIYANLDQRFSGYFKLCPFVCMCVFILDAIAAIVLGHCGVSFAKFVLA